MTIINTGTMKVVRTISVKSALEYVALTPVGLFINDDDAKNGRLIAACANGKAAVVDARTRKLIGLMNIGLGPNAVILDAAQRLAFIPCSKGGVLDMLALDGPRVRHIGRVKAEVRACTVTVNPATGAVSLPTA